MGSALVQSSDCGGRGVRGRGQRPPFSFMKYPMANFLLTQNRPPKKSTFLLNNVSPWEFSEENLLSVLKVAPIFEAALFSSVDLLPLPYLIPVSSFFLVKADPLRFGKRPSLFQARKHILFQTLRSTCLKRKFHDFYSKHFSYKKPNSGHWESLGLTAPGPPTPRRV